MGQPSLDEVFKKPPKDCSQDYCDPYEFYEYQKYLEREYKVKTEEFIYIKEKVKECYYREGVAHYKNCRELVDQIIPGKEYIPVPKPKKTEELLDDASVELNNGDKVK
ncbi:hypothetical protein Gasu2_10330 [Galdieria sulphuraria]|nr:hypothetical protein Gasu2_10330 [Galdieria sulphuraria]